MPPFLNAALFPGGVTSLSAPDDARENEWAYFGADRAFTRNSLLDQIAPENISRVRVLWRRPAVRSSPSYPSPSEK
jgi:glucose dehydrogenase